MPTTTVTGMEMRRLLVYLLDRRDVSNPRGPARRQEQDVPALGYINSRACFARGVLAMASICARDRVSDRVSPRKRGKRRDSKTLDSQPHGVPSRKVWSSMTQLFEVVGSTQMTEQVELWATEAGQLGARQDGREKTYGRDRTGSSDAERATGVGALLIATGAYSGGAGEASRAAGLACEARSEKRAVS